MFQMPSAKGANVSFGKMGDALLAFGSVGMLAAAMQIPGSDAVERFMVDSMRETAVATVEAVTEQPIEQTADDIQTAWEASETQALVEQLKKSAQETVSFVQGQAKDIGEAGHEAMETEEVQALIDNNISNMPGR